MTAIGALLRALWGLVATTAILGGTAAGLIWWAGWPLPDHWPTSAEMMAFAENPLTYPVLKTIVACAGWLLWLTLTTAVGLQTWIQLSHRPLRLRLPRPLQIVTAGLFGAGVLNLAGPAQAHDLSVGTSSAVTSEQTIPHTQTAATPSAARSAAVGEGSVSEDSRRGKPGTTASTGTEDGVTVSGGWIAWPLASGILATSAAALLHGRHPQAASLLLRSIRAARHRQAGPAAEGSNQPATIDDIALLEHDAGIQAGLCIASIDGQVLTVDAIPRSGVGLTGARAADALRGLLAATAATSQATTVVIARDLLNQLASAETRLSNVSVAADTPAALHAIQLEIGARYAANPAPGPAAEHPAMILMTDPAFDDARLNALAVLGHDLNIHIVVNGAWTTGTTWHVDEHGHATDGRTPVGQLNILSQAALTELARILQPAPPARPKPVESATVRKSPTPSSPPWRLHILGRPALTTPTQTAATIRRSGSLQIATYLALHPDGASRTDLIEQIFGDMTSASAAATSLNSCLHELRRVLTIGGRSALLTIDGGYRLDHNQISVDWWQLQALLQRGDLLAAVALYNGPIADGYLWDWLPEHRQTARRLVADTYALLANAADGPHQALDYALAGIDVNPYAEDCYVAAIQAHLQMDNLNGAEILHRNLVQRLARSGARPDHEITKLLQAHSSGSRPQPTAR